MVIFAIVFSLVLLTAIACYLVVPRWSLESFDPMFTESRRMSDTAPSGVRRGGNGGESSASCPDMLIRHGRYLMLYSGTVLVNRFSSIDEYVAYTESQEQTASAIAVNGGAVDAQGNPVVRKRCPVLFLAQESTAQGEDVYREHPDPYLSGGGGGGGGGGGRDRDIPGFNAHGYDEDDAAPPPAPTDPMAVSVNPMDTNWGGVIYSQQAIDAGVYDRHTVGKPTTDPKDGDLPSV